MSRSRKILVECGVYRSAFSGERVIRVTQANGPEYVGVAPVHYCRTADRGVVGPNAPPQGASLKGFVEALLVENGGDTADVSMPDGELITVELAHLADPAEGPSRVPV